MSEFLARFHHTAEQLGDAPCWRYKHSGEWRTLSWNEVSGRVRRLASWFIAQGLQPGECVAVWGSTRMEWCLTDMAVLAAGGVVVPVYHNLPVDQAAFVIGEPGCRFIVLEDGDAETLRALRAECPQLEHLIGMCESSGGDCTATVSHIIADETIDESSYTARWQARRDDALASIVYTSGTSGTPKGVQLNLQNFTAEVDALTRALPFSSEHECLTFLPLAHIVARVLHMYQLVHGFISCFAENIETVGDNIREVRPHFFVGVPRVFEKIQHKIMANVRTLPPLKQKLFLWASNVGNRRRPNPLARALANVILKPVREKMGGRLMVAVSGGAPLAAELGQFFHGLGLLILEGYGLTETTAAVTVNTKDSYRFGTVGQAVLKTQLRIADDGEILIKGPTVFQGYFQRTEETAAVLTDDGWFHTGDVGELSRDGFLRITDRKKDLIKTSGGKYIAPQPIESALKQSSYIADVMVHGDGRKFLSALVTLDESAVQDYAKTAGIDCETWRELALHPAVHQAVQQDVDRVNSELASWETVKRFAILPENFAIDSGELTPTMKVRRKAVCDRYADVLDQIYVAAEREPQHATG